MRFVSSYRIQLSLNVSNTFPDNYAINIGRLSAWATQKHNLATGISKHRFYLHPECAETTASKRRMWAEVAY